MVLAGKINRFAFSTSHDRTLKGGRQVESVKKSRIEPHGALSERPLAALNEAIRRSMLANRGRDTLPEMRLRSALHRIGLRYRVNAFPTPDLRVKADLVFPSSHVAVFVDGCYWHGCAVHRRIPKTNVRFWSEKIDGNRMRDARVDAMLRDADWTVVRVWEHESLESAISIVFDGLRSPL